MTQNLGQPAPVARIEAVEIRPVVSRVGPAAG